MAEHPEWRASDAEREHVVELLRRHLGEGRLDVAEFEERAERAYGARTLGELEPLLADLPKLRSTAGGPPVRAHDLGVRGRWSPELRGYFRTWAALSVMFVLIWLLSGAGYFWPVWPMFGTGVPMLFMLAARQ